MQELAASFVSSLVDLPETSRSTYRAALTVFADFAAPRGSDPSKLGQDVLTAYKVHLVKSAGREEPYKPRTITLYVAVARRFLRWLSLTGKMERAAYTDMADYLEANKTFAHTGGYVAREIDPALDKLIHHYVNIPEPKSKARRLALLRNRALVVFLYDSAVRISEALALSRADVADGRAERVVLRVTKGKKVRTVLIGEQSRRFLQEYIQARDDRSSAPLFASHGRGKGHAITAHQAWRIIKDAAEDEGLMDTTSPHCLRHKRAQDLLDAGMPLDWIAALLGHESPGTTKAVYAPFVDVNRLGSMIKQYGKEPLDA